MTYYKGNLPDWVNREYARSRFFVAKGGLLDESLSKLQKNGYGDNEKEISHNLLLQMNSEDKRRFERYYERFSFDGAGYLVLNGKAKIDDIEVRQALIEERCLASDFFPSHMKQLYGPDWEYNEADMRSNGMLKFRYELIKIRGYYFSGALGLRPYLPKRLLLHSQNCDICEEYNKTVCRSIKTYRAFIEKKFL